QTPLYIEKAARLIDKQLFSLSRFYGQLIPHLTSLLSLNFEVGVLLPIKAGQTKKLLVYKTSSFFYI
ncbi:hypothetical protein ACT4UT_34430, partial [Bacillus sp. B-TM1]